MSLIEKIFPRHEKSAQSFSSIVSHIRTPKDIQLSLESKYQVLIREIDKARNYKKEHGKDGVYTELHDRARRMDEATDTSFVFVRLTASTKAGQNELPKLERKIDHLASSLGGKQEVAWHDEKTKPKNQIRRARYDWRD